MVTKGLNKITQNETQDLQLVDNFCKSWDMGIKKATHRRLMVDAIGLEPMTLCL